MMSACCYSVLLPRSQQYLNCLITTKLRDNTIKRTKNMMHSVNTKSHASTDGDSCLYHKAKNRRKSLAQCFLEDARDNLIKNIRSPPSPARKKSMHDKELYSNKRVPIQLSSDDSDDSSSSDDQEYSPKSSSSNHQTTCTRT